jgi:soluble lytic murein transglycosylase-like protein
MHRCAVAALLGCVFNVLAAESGDTNDSMEKQRRSIDRQLASVQRQTTAVARTKKPDSSDVAPPGCHRIEDERIAGLADKAAARHEVSSALIRAVIRQESGGDPCAVSPKGALGLMQIMPEVADELNLASPFDAEQNIDAGVRRLKQLLGRFNSDLSLALAAYNAGEGAVERSGGVPNFEETKRYVASVLAAIHAQ